MSKSKNNLNNFIGIFFRLMTNTVYFRLLLLSSLHEFFLQHVDTFVHENFTFAQKYPFFISVIYFVHLDTWSSVVYMRYKNWNKAIINAFLPCVSESKKLKYSQHA